MVTRYDMDTNLVGSCMMPRDDGDYVHIDDHDALAAHLAEVERERDRLREYAAQAIENCHTVIVAMGLSSTATMAECVTRAKLVARAERLRAVVRGVIDHAFVDTTDGGCCRFCLAEVGAEHSVTCIVAEARAALADVPEPSSCPECERLREVVADLVDAMPTSAAYYCAIARARELLTPDRPAAEMKTANTEIDDG